MDIGSAKKKKILIAILGICALLLVVWGILVISIFQGGKGKKNTKDGSGIWVLVSKEDGARGMSYAYDSKGRLIHAEPNNDGSAKGKYEYDLEYYYDGDVPVTKMTYKKTGYGREEREEYTYYPSGKIRTHADYWDADLGIYTYREVYDEKQRVIHEYDYDEEGKLSSDTQTVYDGNGYVISCETHYADGQIVQSKRGELDSEGRVTKVYKYNQGEWIFFEEIEYSEDGGRISKNYQTHWVETETDGNEGLWRTDLYYAFRLDAENRVVEYWDYDYWTNTEPVLRIHYIYEYSETKDRRREVQTTGPEEKYQFTHIKEYDLNDRLVYEERIDQDGSTVQEYLYDEHGNLCMQRSFKNGVLSNEFVYTNTYDSYGNLLSVVSKSDKNTYKYEKIQISEEQIAENAKFYMDFPEHMEIIQKYR